MVVYLNGAYLPEGEAWVSVSDQGLLLGLGAFETMRAYGGCVFRLGAHLERLARSLALLGIRPRETTEALGDAVGTLLGRLSLGEARVRITVTAGSSPAPGDEVARPTTLVTAGPLGAPPVEAYRTGISAVRQDLPHGLGPWAGHKITSYAGFVLARRAATLRGAGEAVLVTAGDRVVEGAHSNVFVVEAGEVLTPPLGSGALPGVTRAVILELLAAQSIPGGEQELSWADIKRSQEIFVTSSIAEVLPVTRLEGAPVGDGTPGPLTGRLARAYREIVARETAL